MGRSGLAVCIQMPALTALMSGAVAESDTCTSPAPAPPAPYPPSPPSPPTPGTKCCHYNDESSACSSGEVCCSGSGKSYGSESTCSQYGAKHKCHWTGGECIVGGS